jgi:hypothetical protein
VAAVLGERSFASERRSDAIFSRPTSRQFLRVRARSPISAACGALYLGAPTLGERALADRATGLDALRRVRRRAPWFLRAGLTAGQPFAPRVVVEIAHLSGAFRPAQRAVA